jgi:ABC-type antimicrobial peptide transport system permease subunit
VAQYVAERRREIAISVALGAQPRTIVVTVAGPALRLTVLGMAIGAGLAAAAAMLVRSQLIGIQTFDAPSMIGGIAILVAVAVASCAWPTWRATRTDPILVVRQQ